jgi:hypothetical protein
VATFAESVAPTICPSGEVAATDGGGGRSRFGRVGCGGVGREGGFEGACTTKAFFVCLAKMGFEVGCSVVRVIFGSPIFKGSGEYTAVSEDL